MIVQNLQPVPVEIETLGPWRLDGRVVETGTVVSVLPSLAADLIARGKARPFVPAPAVEAVVPVDDVPPVAPPPDPETPPAPTPFARGKK
jgi:hypothetical protein